MAAKQKSFYSCQSCGAQTPKWLGRCPDCGEWNTLVEEKVISANPEARRPGYYQGLKKEPVSITEIEGDTETRFLSDITEMDRVLGGGIVPGSVVLVGGDPGIGKSTLLLQTLGILAKKGLNVIYVTGEESAAQTSMRGRRLGCLEKKLLVLPETCLEEIIPRLEKIAPTIIVIDSIQTIFTNQMGSAPGSVSQVREVASHLMRYAKEKGAAIFLVGHVTKDGAIAGPRVLEHLADTVLYFEGDRGHSYRILRAHKNRFGSTNEIGIFEMRKEGLREVLNPSELFLSDRTSIPSGSVVVSCMEGTRPILVELQALVTRSNNPGMPRRMSSGVDHNRLSMLIAILEKRMGLQLQEQDIFVNAAGGLKLNEPSVDLGIIAAIASSFLNKDIDPGVVVMGEAGLGGEIRPVSQLEIRISEAEKLGFMKCLIPKTKNLETPSGKKLKLAGISSVQEAFDALF